MDVGPQLIFGFQPITLETMKHVAAFLLLFSVPVFAEGYHSEADDLVTVRKITILPLTDNLQGIYARPLQTFLVEQAQKTHRWDYVESNWIGPVISPEDFAREPQKLEEVSKSIPADAFVISRIYRTPKGVSMSVHLYLTKDHKLFSQSETKDFQQTDIESVKAELNKLFTQTMSKIPYSGRVLSRQNNRVTINLGSSDGIQTNQVLSVIQILNIQRHPKFGFIISTEKELLGKIKVLKVDETLSFATVVSERERGAIQKDSKIGPLDMVVYPETDSLSPDAPPAAVLAESPSAEAVYGKNPDAWVPVKPPSFGSVGVRLGVGTLADNMKLQSEGSLSSSANLYPSVALDAELWLTSEFSVHAAIGEGIASIGNPLGGSTPNSLSLALSSYEMLVGYNFRFGSDVWGPKLEALIGYSTMRYFVDDSTPTSYTSMEYSGFKFGVDGSTPVTSDRTWGAGAQLFFMLSPHLAESPVTSGSSAKTTVNQFAIYGYRKFGEHIKAIGKLDFQLDSTSFSGSGTRTDSATSSSQRMTVLSGGIAYLF